MWMGRQRQSYGIKRYTVLNNIDRLQDFIYFTKVCCTKRQEREPHQDPLKLLPKLPNCGKEEPKTRIFGGNVTSLSEHPWTVQLLYRIGTFLVLKKLVFNFIIYSKSLRKYRKIDLRRINNQ